MRMSCCCKLKNHSNDNEYRSSPLSIRTTCKLRCLRLYIHLHAFSYVRMRVVCKGALVAPTSGRPGPSTVRLSWGCRPPRWIGWTVCRGLRLGLNGRSFHHTVYSKTLFENNLRIAIAIMAFGFLPSFFLTPETWRSNEVTEFWLICSFDILKLKNTSIIYYKRFYFGLIISVSPLIFLFINFHIVEAANRTYRSLQEAYLEKSLW